MKKTAAPQKSKKLLLVGRKQEVENIRACLQAGKNLLLEGPVGVGKTHLVLALARELKLKVYRVDGDSRYTEQKLSGWFDPPIVIKKGFVESAFVPGPLTEAMRAGGVLFINELNRLPEGVQNILLPAIDEKTVEIPKLGTLHAKPGFLVVATQNPKEFVATSHLSEAILDRFEWISLDYQSEVEEIEIVLSQTKGAEQIAPRVVSLIRATRNHPRVRRGASIRAALSICDLAVHFIKEGLSRDEALLKAALIAVPTRIELEPDAESELSPQQEIGELIRQWLGLSSDKTGGKKNSAI